MKWGVIFNSIGQDLGFDVLIYYLIGAAIITAIVSLLIAGIYVALNKYSNGNDFSEAFKNSAMVIGTIFFFILVLSSC